MRFRGLITDVQQMHYLLRVLQSIAKTCDRFVVRLSDSEMHLISERKQSSAAFVVKAVLKADDFFQDYCFRGVNNDNNLIYFGLRSECWTQVFHSLQPNIKSLKMKLCYKSGNSVLALEVDYPTNDSDRQIKHDIRIEIIERHLWDTVWDSDLGSFDLCLYLPESLSVSSTIERFNDLCNHILIKTKAVDNTKAILTVVAETESICVKTKFSQLELNPNNQMDSNSSHVNQCRDWVSVRVDVKKLNQIFNSLKQLKPDSIVILPNVDN